MVDEETVWELSVHHDGSRVRLAVFGELDLDSAPKLLAAVVEQLQSPPAELVIDLAELAFIDSSGLGALVGCWRRAQHAGTALSLANPAADVAITLEITGLDQVLPIVQEKN